MRIQGGTAGILAALASGRLEINGWIAEAHHVRRLTVGDVDKIKRREEQRKKRLDRAGHW